MTDALVSMSPTELVGVVAAGSHRLETSVAGLDPSALQEPSTLPGWSRGHVVAHLTHNADAFAQVTAAALRGELRETYPGGQAARDAAIERDADRPAADALAQLRRAQAQLHELWTVIDDRAWQLPVAFRAGTVLHLLASRWREVEIHHTDLLVGYGSTRWSSAFSHHAVDFLLPRLSEAGALELAATDTGRRWPQGRADRVRIDGEAHQLAAWLAGRDPDQALTTSGRELPDLGPWP